MGGRLEAPGMVVARARRWIGLAAAFSLVAAVQTAAPIAAAQCADPRGNAYCGNGGQVTFNPPPAQGAPSSQPCADPRGNAYCQSNPTTPQVVAPAPATGAPNTGGAATNTGGNATGGAPN